MDPEGRTLAPPYHLFTRNGVRIGVIGIGNPETPVLVRPSRWGQYRFLDPVPVINRYAKELRERGVEIVVVIAHIGAHSVGAEGLPTGLLGDVARAVRGVDVLLGDHTGVAVNTVVNAMIVVENLGKGIQYAVIDLEYDRSAKRIVGRSSVQRWAFADGVTLDPEVQLLISGYRAQLSPILDTRVAETRTVLTRSSQHASLVGNLVADMLLERYGAQVAFLNSGAFRSDIPSSYRPDDPRLRRTDPGYAAGPPYDIVVGDLLTAFPFSNDAVTFIITGATLWQALEHSVGRVLVDGSRVINTDGRFLQIAGFRFGYDPGKPPGQRVVAVTLADGTPVPKDATAYRAVTLDFVYAGGDGYTMLNNGSGTTREPLTDIMREAMARMGTVSASPEERIIVAGGSRS